MSRCRESATEPDESHLRPAGRRLSSDDLGADRRRGTWGVEASASLELSHDRRRSVVASVLRSHRPSDPKLSAHNPEVSLLTCHNPNKKGSPETRDFRAYAGRPKRDVAPRRDSAWKREHSRKRNPLRGLAIVASEGVGLRMGARENPGVTNFATPGFKWRGQDSNLRPRGYEPRELPGCSTARRCEYFYRTWVSVPVIESRFPADCSKSVSKTHTSWANVNAVARTA